MPTPMYRPAATLLGLYAETRHLTGVVITRRAGFWQPRGAGREPLPEGAVSNGRILDFDAVRASLSVLRKRLSRHNDQVAISLPAALATTRHLQLPAGSAATLRALVQLEAPRHLNLPMDSVYLDFIAAPPTREFPSRRDVMLVAAARRDVDPWLEACRSADLQPRVVDLDAHALIRALRWSQPGALSGHGRTLTALIVIEPTWVSVLIVAGERLALQQTEPLTNATDPITTTTLLTTNSLQAFPAAAAQPAPGQLLLIGQRSDTGLLMQRLTDLTGIRPQPALRPRSLSGRRRHAAVPADFASFTATGLALWRSRP